MHADLGAAIIFGVAFVFVVTLALIIVVSKRVARRREDRRPGLSVVAKVAPTENKSADS